MIDFAPDADAILAQFNRLMQELLTGAIRRNTFRAWEIELLIDIEKCDLRGPGRREMLKRYQKAVQKHMERGGAHPFKLSEYISSQRARRERLAAS
jgi:hypothetical protein